MIKLLRYKFVYGNLDDIIRESYSSCLRKWSSEFGKTYG